MERALRFRREKFDNSELESFLNSTRLFLVEERYLQDYGRTRVKDPLP